MPDEAYFLNHFMVRLKILDAKPFERRVTWQRPLDARQQRRFEAHSSNVLIFFYQSHGGKIGDFLRKAFQGRFQHFQLSVGVVIVCVYFKR